MNLPGYYSSGQFARLAGVSLKTIRFYDKQNILKPSYRNPSGARFYTEADFARLQQILLLKYLGFSLEDIKELSIDTTDQHLLLNSLQLQKKLVRDRIEQMEMVETAIEDTVAAIQREQQIDWSHMLDLIHLTGMEKSLKTQYQDASNISARIRLHRDFSVNEQGWFPWIFEQCRVQSGMRVLEIGCGNGALWTENSGHLPERVEVVLSDISEGMLRDARRAVAEKMPWMVQQNQEGGSFDFQVIDGHTIPYPDASFDLVIANHLLFYCEDVLKVCREVKRVLKPDGRFVCSTYGRQHMKEITHLVQEFDSRIVLAAENLYERFGLEHGGEMLHQVFEAVSMVRYEDEIQLSQPEPLLEYILSCHGNQNQILLDKYKEFKNFVTEKTRYGFKITKDAGIFIASIESENKKI
ncbi:MAG: methyltransferase domain-containing protein [Lachnospiraceae bacterium]|nr:methyltransferase domain-containing protein [Lachnospiraceae bacterium]